MKFVASLLSAAFLMSCGPVTVNAQAQGNPVEPKPPNAPNQEPAFPGQTRAPAAEQVPVRAETVVEGLDQAWAFEFLPDGRMLVTEKSGTMRIIGADGDGRVTVEGVPEVDSRGQGGLLDVALGPDFTDDRMVYFSFSEPRDDGNGTTLARARLVEQGGGAALENVEILFRQMPSWTSTKHFGSRIVFAPDGNIFLTVGERGQPQSRDLVQDLDNHFGKVIRLQPDGSVPPDNPFVDTDGARSEIWSYGHRNVQSATLDGEGQFWLVEHGPRGGDELNQPEAGKNYGWPVITYGLAYSGKPFGQGITKKEDMEQPVYYWDPVIAPSGMDFYEGDLIPEWQGSFLIGGLVSHGVVRLVMEDGRVAAEERIDLGARIRDVKVGPDGAVYAVTDGGSGRILRIVPDD
ncbi:PQQ-dependent sugar dehydrogenase [Geminicoccus roseus]|uniref:PQQ-dependent sugar dehydrogenase n=1 Tax=Geminicoccus roseus TaxID=404900 RepID=UPI000402E1F8|nr:PQQ-dependent sugar dehydrogenase [Geminicoccus roseus]